MAGAHSSGVSCKCRVILRMSNDHERLPAINGPLMKYNAIGPWSMHPNCISNTRRTDDRPGEHTILFASRARHPASPVGSFKAGVGMWMGVSPHIQGKTSWECHRMSACRMCTPLHRHTPHVHTSASTHPACAHLCIDTPRMCTPLHRHTPHVHTSASTHPACAHLCIDTPRMGAPRMGATGMDAPRTGWGRGR